MHVVLNIIHIDNGLILFHSPKYGKYIIPLVSMYCDRLSEISSVDITKQQGIFRVIVSQVYTYQYVICTPYG